MRETPLWLWPNLLSLDAPAVALVWQDFAAHAFGNPLRIPARIVLGLTVWAIYMADRWLDSRAAGPAPNTPRHDFYLRHARTLNGLLMGALAVDVFLATVQLRRAVFVDGLLVAVGVTAYLAIFPLRASGWEKQVAAAILFSIGVLLVTGTWMSPLRLLLPAVLFAALCFCNLLLIEMWERDKVHRLDWLAPAALALLAAARSAGHWHLAVALSGGLLAVIAGCGRRLTVDAKHVLADIALLVPLLFR
jgi:hypothetical protein